MPGVVTAVRAFGSARDFWVQDPRPDRDPATSEAVFVFTGSSTPKVAVGDAIEVSGTVTEYYPGGADAGLQSVTELTRATWTVRAWGQPLPAAFTLDPAAVPQRYAPTAGEGGSIESLRLRPGRYALDRYESLEGMRVAVRNTPVVGATSEHKELWVTAEPYQDSTARGGVLYDSYRKPGSGRVKVASLIPYAERSFPVANVRDRLRRCHLGAARLRPVRRVRDPGHRTRRAGGRRAATRTHPPAGLPRAGHRHVQRGEPVAEDASGQVRPVGAGAGTRPGLARHRRPSGGAGRQRPHQRLRRLRRRDAAPAQRDHQGGGRALLLLEPDRPRRRPGRRPARRQHPQRLPLQPRAGLLHRHRGRRRHHASGGRRRRASPVGVPGPDRPGERGMADQPQAAGRRVHLPLAAGLRGGQPLQLQGRRPGPGRPVPTAPARLGGAADRAGQGGQRVREGRAGGQAPGERGGRGRHQRLPVLARPGRPDRRRGPDRPGGQAAQAGALRLRLQRQLAGPGPHPDQQGRAPGRVRHRARQRGVRRSGQRPRPAGRSHPPRNSTWAYGSAPPLPTGRGGAERGRPPARRWPGGVRPGPGSVSCGCAAPRSGRPRSPSAGGPRRVRWWSCAGRAGCSRPTVQGP